MPHLAKRQWLLTRMATPVAHLPHPSPTQSLLWLAVAHTDKRLGRCQFLCCLPEANLIVAIRTLPNFFVHSIRCQIQSVWPGHSTILHNCLIKQVIVQQGTENPRAIRGIYTNSPTQSICKLDRQYSITCWINLNNIPIHSYLPTISKVQSV